MYKWLELCAIHVFCSMVMERDIRRRAARGSIPFISTRLDCGVTHHTNFRPSIQFQVEYSRWHRKELVLVDGGGGADIEKQRQKSIYSDKLSPLFFFKVLAAVYIYIHLYRERDGVLVDKNLLLLSISFLYILPQRLHFPLSPLFLSLLRSFFRWCLVHPAIIRKLLDIALLMAHHIIQDFMGGSCSKQSYYKSTPEITQQAASLPPPLVPISHPPLPPLEPIEDKVDSTDPLDRFQFLFDNPLLLQDLISIEKLKTFQDDLSVSHGQTIQTVSLRRLSNLISTQRIQIRLTADKLVLVIPTEFIRNYEHVTIDARLCPKDSAPDCLLQVFYDLDTNNFGENGSNCVLLNHNFKLDCWELVGCLAPFYEPPTSPVSPVLCIDVDDSGSISPMSDEIEKVSILICMIIRYCDLYWLN